MESGRKAFQYQPKCSAPGCGEPAVFKVAAAWNSGASHELKTYGLACEAHRDSQLARAHVHRQGLRLAEGESIGPVGLYAVEAGRRDAELKRLPDH
jgi:hypothetical protein